MRDIFKAIGDGLLLLALLGIAIGGTLVAGEFVQAMKMGLLGH